MTSAGDSKPVAWVGRRQHCRHCAAAAQPRVGALSNNIMQSRPPSLGEGEDPENVRAVVGAIREGRSAGRRAMQQERRAIIDRKEWRTGDADRLRAIDRTLADLAFGALD